MEHHDSRDSAGHFTRQELRAETSALREAHRGRHAQSPWWLPAGTRLTKRGDLVVGIVLTIAFLFFLALAGGVEL